MNRREDTKENFSVCHVLKESETKKAHIMRCCEEESKEEIAESKEETTESKEDTVESKEETSESKETSAEKKSEEISEKTEYAYVQRPECAKEDWRILTSRAQSGDRAAMEQMVTDNTGLIHMVLARFLHYNNNNNRCDREELFQVGAIGLVRAIECFDLNREVAFSTYAVPMIIGEIRRFLRDDGIIHVGRRIRENAAKLAAARERLIREKNRDPSIRELMEATGLSQEDIAMALEASVSVESIHKPIPGSDRSKEQTLEDQLVDEEHTDARLVDHLTVQSLLEKLPQKERKLIELRYLAGRTQSETAQELGMSQVGVSRLEKKVLGMMRRELV